MTAPSFLHHVVYILSELVPWFILASIWILFHKDKFCHRAVVCFNVSKQPVDYIFLYKFTEPICWSFILREIYIPEEIKEKSIGVDGDLTVALKEIRKERID